MKTPTPSPRRRVMASSRKGASGKPSAPAAPTPSTADVLRPAGATASGDDGRVKTAKRTRRKPFVL
jgi:hypothetical protein